MHSESKDENTEKGLLVFGNEGKRALKENRKHVQYSYYQVRDVKN